MLGVIKFSQGTHFFLGAYWGGVVVCVRLKFFITFCYTTRWVVSDGAHNPDLKGSIPCGSLDVFIRERLTNYHKNINWGWGSVGAC